MKKQLKTFYISDKALYALEEIKKELSHLESSEGSWVHVFNELITCWYGSDDWEKSQMEYKLDVNKELTDWIKKQEGCVTFEEIEQKHNDILSSIKKKLRLNRVLKRTQN